MVNIAGSGLSPQQAEKIRRMVKLSDLACPPKYSQPNFWDPGWFQPQSLIKNPEPLVKALFDAGFTCRLPMLIWPHAVIECGLGTQALRELDGAALKETIEEAIAPWKRSGVTGQIFDDGRIGIYIPLAKPKKKPGRPRKDDLRIAVQQLRAEGKSWATVTRMMNRAKNLNYQQTAYRNLVQRDSKKRL